MKTNSGLLVVLLLAALVIIYLAMKLRRVQTQLLFIKDATSDMKNGDLNRRVLARENDMTRQICYDINEIAMNSQMQLIAQKQSEQAYKRLMTSLSHDVKTPLASLVGYLEAIENRLVEGREKEEYIRVAYNKAQQLKTFVESLFEWVKLDAGEQVFHFERCDLNEVTRNIIADWIPILEGHGFEYEISIPEAEYMVRIDSNAYTRVINNLFQNAINHSGGSMVHIMTEEDDGHVRITVADNGKGIAPADLPHVFERMYQGDQSRSAKGNGLGLSIAKELVVAHNGSINVENDPDGGALFAINLPIVL